MNFNVTARDSYLIVLKAELIKKTMEDLRNQDLPPEATKLALEDIAELAIQIENIAKAAADAQ